MEAVLADVLDPDRQYLTGAEARGGREERADARPLVLPGEPEQLSGLLDREHPSLTRLARVPAKPFRRVCRQKPVELGPPQGNRTDFQGVADLLRGEPLVPEGDPEGLQVGAGDRREPSPLEGWEPVGSHPAEGVKASPPSDPLAVGELFLDVGRGSIQP